MQNLHKARRKPHKPGQITCCFHQNSPRPLETSVVLKIGHCRHFARSSFVAFLVAIVSISVVVVKEHNLVLSAETGSLTDQKLLSSPKNTDTTNSITSNRPPVVNKQQEPQATNHNRQKEVSPVAKPAINYHNRNGAKRAPARLVKQQDSSLREIGSATNINDDANLGLQISITPRNGQIRVPVGENTILKCLISSQVNKFTKKFDVHWSRYMYDEKVYEEIGTGNEYSSLGLPESNLPNQPNSDPTLLLATDANSQPATEQRDSDNDISDSLLGLPVDRQQQVRDFQSRSRQEKNPISDLLIEATLAISRVKASDNATYYCTARDGSSSAPSSASFADQQNNRARIDLVALSKPVVKLERLQPARDSKSAIVHWLIVSHGNTPIKRTILMVRNESLHHHHHHHLTHQQQQDVSGAPEATGNGYGSSSSSVVVDGDNNQWQRIDIPGDGEMWPPNGAGSALTGTDERPAGQAALEDIVVRADVDVTSPMGSGGPLPDWFNGAGGPFQRPDRRKRSFNLTSLLPGVTYKLRLAAINDMGQSRWTHLNATMPNEIPAQISEIVLLSRSNDSLTIGWKRPAYDGAKTIRYEMQLFDLNRTLTLDANTNTSTIGGGAGSTMPIRTNFMYIFVNLKPGTDYHFHVRPCSRVGCGPYSNPKLLASTMDGEPDEPLDVELACQMDTGNVSVSWLPPVNSHGQLTNYSVTLESYSKFVNQSTGEWQVKESRNTMDTLDSQNLSLDMGNLLMPNTNYSVRVCANNRSKHCGRPSQITTKAQCSTIPDSSSSSQLPSNITSNNDPSAANNNKSLSFNEFATNLAASLRSNATKLYQTASSFVTTNFKLDAIGNYIMRSSPMMQLLQVGVIVLGLSLFLLLVIYLISLPNSMRRKRKRKLKRQLQKHQEAANEDYTQQQKAHLNHPPADNNYDPPPSQINGGFASSQLQQMADDNENLLLDQSINHQQQQVAYGMVVQPRNPTNECPIHSSPMARNQLQQEQLDSSEATRRPSVHICQPMQANYVTSMQQIPYGTLTHHAHHHHHHHHALQQQRQQQQQLVSSSNHAINYVNPDMMPRQRDQYERNCRTTRRVQANGLGAGGATEYGYDINRVPTNDRNFTLSHHNSVLALAKKINKSIPLGLFGAVLECRLRNSWLREEYEQLPRQQFANATTDNGLGASQNHHHQLLLKLRPQLIVSRNDTVSALISGNDLIDASLIRGSPLSGVGSSNAAGGGEKRIICAKSPLDADSVWDFWRLVYEQEVGTMVMLTQTEDQQTGELRCAQYWPTCDNEETTILSPCNEFVQKSTILPAKFKIRQETLEEESSENEFRVRRLTLMVMATKPSENEQNEELREPCTATSGASYDAATTVEANGDTTTTSGTTTKQEEEEEEVEPAAATEDDDDEGLVIVERTILHLQYFYWNTSSLANQMRIIKFIEMANERHSRHQQQQQQQESPNSISGGAPAGTMLVHCSNGLGRSGLFTAMSFVIDELSVKLGQQQQHQPKLNIFQLVSRLRGQREMILSPYRLYELLYQLTLNCIPATEALAG